MAFEQYFFETSETTTLNFNGISTLEFNAAGPYRKCFGGSFCFGTADSNLIKRKYYTISISTNDQIFISTPQENHYEGVLAGIIVN